eukprot:6329220-Lingulodinium_polyedra.AAC.1
MTYIAYNNRGDEPLIVDRRPKTAHWTSYLVHLKQHTPHNASSNIEHGSHTIRATRDALGNARYTLCDPRYAFNVSAMRRVQCYA